MKFSLNLRWSLPLLLMLPPLLFISCDGGNSTSSEGTVDNSPPPSTDQTDGTTTTFPSDQIIEGNTGFLFRDATECFGNAAMPIAGTSVYVSPNGDDTNNGDSAQLPLKTLAKALCNAGPGQTVYLLPGTYHESVIMGDFGNATDGITISGVTDPQNPDLLPLLDGDKLRTFGLAITESQKVTVKNIEFRNHTDAGLFVALSDTVTITANIFDSNGFNSISTDAGGEGFGLLASDLTNAVISNNEALNNGPNADLQAQGVLGTAINTYNLNNAVISGNHAHHNIGCGILIEEGVEVTVSNNEIDHNELLGDYWDAAIWLDGGHGVSVMGNTIHDNLGPAFQVSDSELQYPYGSCGYTITGNTITGNYWALFTYNMHQCPLPDTSYLIFTDNTTSNNLYPGNDQESLDGTYGEMLCHLWPCGENQPCVEPDPGSLPTTPVCAAAAN
ncbi:MAG: right-handed parallel beta-helix repeat-containing protein [Proteobacteria bacterium]|nr:right-handed parallel beta-helix repeat-containing protein [Pseudomonadota bacterium]MBU1689015.1 right-handed parallel beta-helix repeat-containing protein [Pseudomonadota bacterium]